MKMRKKIVAFTMAFAILFGLAVSVFANNGITPRYNNLNNTFDEFDIDSDGLATFTVMCKGIQGVTTRIEITVQIQKKTLLWWNDVDGGRYFFERNDYQCSFWTNKQLSKSGKYRIVVDYTVYGTNGSADTVTSQKEASY